MAVVHVSKKKSFVEQAWLVLRLAECISIALRLFYNCLSFYFFILYKVRDGLLCRYIEHFTFFFNNEFVSSCMAFSVKKNKKRIQIYFPCLSRKLIWNELSLILLFVIVVQIFPGATSKIKNSNLRYVLWFQRLRWNFWLKRKNARGWFFKGTQTTVFFMLFGCRRKVLFFSVSCLDLHKLHELKLQPENLSAYKMQTVSLV